MLSAAFPLSNIQPPESLRLGCLIVNPEDIGQASYDPFEDRPIPSEINTSDCGTFHETQKLSKSSKIRSFLSDVLSISREQGHKDTSTLDAAQVTIKSLRNHENWFEDACGIPETRKWLERAHNDGLDTYLLVGFFIARDSKVTTNSNSTTGGGIGTDIPLLPTTLTMIGTIIGAAAGAQFTRDVSYGRISVLEIPGDKILGIWYRKVKFKWLASKDIGNPSLDKKTRWKPSWVWRDAEEEDNAWGEEGEEEDEEEAGDILDVGLEGEDEDEGNDSDCGDNFGEEMLDIPGCPVEPTSTSAQNIIETLNSTTKRKRGQDDVEETQKVRR